MSSWGKERGGPLPPSDVDAIVAFLQTWKTKSPATLDERPVGGDITRGAVAYNTHCVKCHGPSGTTGPNVRIGNPEFLAWDELKQKYASRLEAVLSPLIIC